MARQVQLRRGNSTATGAFTGAVGEVTVDTTDNRLVVHDNATAGGFPAAKEGEILKQGRHTIWVPANAMTPATTSGAEAVVNESSTSITTAASLTYSTLDFDGAADEFANFQIAMPKNWDEGTITAQAWWSTTSALSTDTVLWWVQGVARSDDEAIAATWGTAISMSDAPTTAANDILVSPESGSITINGTPLTGDLTFFRIYRDVSSDSLVADAKLHGIKIFHTLNATDDT